MVHESNDGSKSLQQVELNTIASSFGCLGSLTTDMHQFLVERYDLKPSEINGAVPANSAMNELPFAMAEAYKHYGNTNAVIVFVVQPGEVNSVDQRLLEFELWRTARIRVLRKSLLQVNDSIYCVHS